MWLPDYVVEAFCKYGVFKKREGHSTKSIVGVREDAPQWVKDEFEKYEEARLAGFK